MVDTLRGDFVDEKCSDCGELGCIIKHWGFLVPKGEKGCFCVFCWNERMKADEVKPLGVNPPRVPRKFKNRAIKVVTEKGSIYKFSKPDEKGKRTVTCIERGSEEEIDFTECKIICLVEGREGFLHPFNRGELEYHGWWTSPVVSIE